MNTKHKSERNHMIAKKAYENVYKQKYEDSTLYGTYYRVLDEILGELKK